MMRHLLGVLLLLLFGVSAAGAQVTDSVRGRLIDQDGAPLPDQGVLLHRVVGNAGANIAEGRTDADGRFTVTVDSADNADAVYFLAARWEGELYIGEAFRAPVGATEHVLQVGVPGTSASALIDGTEPGPPMGMPQGGAPAGAGGRPATGASWLLFAVPAIALLGVVAYFLLRGRTAVPERRRLLVELAELDLEHAAAPTADYRARRARLLEQLHDTSA